MHRIAHIISFTAAGALITDVILNIQILSRCRKTIKRLCNENSGLHVENTHLKAENALLHRTLKDANNELTLVRNKLASTTAAKDKQITELTHQMVKATDDRDRTVGVINNLSKENRENRAKLKSAHDHISVLRAEIVKLNRQLQLAKRRGVKNG